MRTLIKILCLVLLLAGLSLLVFTQTVTPCPHCNTVSASSAAASIVSTSSAPSSKHASPHTGNHIKTLRIFYPGADHQPYLLPSKKGQHSGIIQALLGPFLSAHHYRLKLVHLPRARVLDSLYNGKLDLAMGNPSWYGPDNQLHFSRPLVGYSDYIFQRANFGSVITDWQDLSGERVCTHVNYRYQQLEQMTEQHLITLVSSGSTTLMLRMFLAGRCDFLIGENLVIRYLSKQGGAARHIKRSRLTDNTWAVGLAAAPHLTDFITRLNKYLDSDEYQKHRQHVRQQWALEPPPTQY